jgi:hypothetical protein
MYRDFSELNWRAGAHDPVNLGNLVDVANEIG